MTEYTDVDIGYSDDGTCCGVRLSVPNGEATNMVAMSVAEFRKLAKQMMETADMADEISQNKPRVLKSLDRSKAL